ncbi:MAG: outer membrane protein assembly factor BamA [Betaproteobacteria bacterium]|nr:outer membrane protein assembly factor BamA [Betaproteobacteria bacterium]MBL8534665.1 outer membrane protein assembly factor BamA [Betaproteobacteria bacterium]
MKRLLIAVLFLLAQAPLAYSFEPFQIQDIRVEGIQRTEAGTIFGYLPVKVGDTLTAEKATASVRLLYGTGFFKDVQIENDNGVLVVIVQERPAIASIDIRGSKEFDKKKLLEIFRSTGLQEGRIFDRVTLERAKQDLKSQYISRGKYGVEVQTTVNPLERNRVGINFNVVESQIAKIASVNLVGNHVFSDKQLLDLMVLRSPGLMTWYTRNDQYSRQKLSADLETLRSFYLNQGYLESSIESTQVALTPDKKNVFITINIVEGQKYTVSDVKLAGEFPVPEEELRKLIKMKPGDVFSRERLTETTKLMGDRLGNDGYAFAQVNPVPDIDKEKRTVSFTMYVDPGRRVYIRRINIAGNTTTKDEVIRREFRQMEGAWYSQEKINRSKVRADRLGYFSEVNVETPAVEGTTDQVDVNMSVKERPTGSVSFGAGFSSVERVILTASVSQQNAFGTGNAISLGLQTGRINRVLTLSYTNPYWTDDGVSRGFDLYTRRFNPSFLRLATYATNTDGGGVRFGIPVSELDTVNLGLSVESTDIEIFTSTPQRFRDFVSQYGSVNSAILGTIGFSRDGRDNTITPTSGPYQRVQAEISLPGGDLRYYRLTYLGQRYWPITRLSTLQAGVTLGYAAGYQDNPLPFYKNFYAGGVNSVRGFYTYGIGPRDEFGLAIGAPRQILGNLEYYFPFPGADKDKSLRLSAFVDAGMVDNTFNVGQLRFSTGFALNWFSPVGPLKLSFGIPIKKEPNDRLQRIQFQLGTIF